MPNEPARQLAGSGNRVGGLRIGLGEYRTFSSEPADRPHCRRSTWQAAGPS